jgi:hypothetical protein
MAGKTRLLSIPHDNPTADTTPLEAAALAVQHVKPPRERLQARVGE